MNADLHENFCACSKLFFWTSVLLRSPTITDDYSVHQLSHKALLVLYQRPWTITNVSSRTLWCDGAFSKSHTHISSTHTNTNTHTFFKVSFSLSLSPYLLSLSLSLSLSQAELVNSVCVCVCVCVSLSQAELVNSDPALVTLSGLVEWVR